MLAGDFQVTFQVLVSTDKALNGFDFRYIKDSFFPSVITQ